MAGNGVEVLYPASEPAHPNVVAAARHERKMVRALHSLYHGEVRHEHVKIVLLVFHRTVFSHSQGQEP